jgi:hypothetical protein
MHRRLTTEITEDTKGKTQPISFSVSSVSSVVGM